MTDDLNRFDLTAKLERIDTFTTKNNSMERMRRGWMTKMTRRGTLRAMESKKVKHQTRLTPAP